MQSSSISARMSFSIAVLSKSGRTLSEVALGTDGEEVAPDNCVLSMCLRLNRRRLGMISADVSSTRSITPPAPSLPSESGAASSSSLSAVRPSCRMNLRTTSGATHSPCRLLRNVAISLERIEQSCLISAIEPH